MFLPPPLPGQNYRTSHLPPHGQNENDPRGATLPYSQELDYSRRRRSQTRARFRNSGTTVKM